MHIHILGICGTFMGGIAMLARQKGWDVTGSDANVYPPMSDQLTQSGIKLWEGYDAEILQHIKPDLFVIGNAMKRGMPIIEAMLNQSLPFCSGPEWLRREILQHKHVLAVAGTHGKTTVSSMLAYILAASGKDPGFLIGGIPQDFAISAHWTTGDYFVVEADEYDTAFFDKRSKFVHYQPRTLVLNNLEFDHADIFPNLAAIQTQFHHLIRIIPEQGLVIAPARDLALQQVLDQGCWTPVQYVHAPSGWQAMNIAANLQHFEVFYETKKVGEINWKLSGQHNIHNALMAIAAATRADVSAAEACKALCSFAGVKRRMELRGEVCGVRVIDDFAHHPTAIAKTLQGAKATQSEGRVLAVLEMRSNTMRSGFFKEDLPQALCLADQVFVYLPAEMSWQLPEDEKIHIFHQISDMVARIVQNANAKDTILVMSNGEFAGIHQQLLSALKVKYS